MRQHVFSARARLRGSRCLMPAAPAVPGGWPPVGWVLMWIDEETLAWVWWPSPAQHPDPNSRRMKRRSCDRLSGQFCVR